MAKLVAAIFIASVFSSYSLAKSNEEKAQAVIDTRQGLLKVVGLYMHPMVGMVKGKIEYDATVVEKNAEKIAQLAFMLPDVFAADVRTSGLSSGSLDAAWEDRKDFIEKSRILSLRAQALSESAKESKTMPMKKFGAMGKACKNCHRSYRKK